MICFLHSYTDTFNHEIQSNTSLSTRLITKATDIKLKDSSTYNYNSKTLLEKILNKVIVDLNARNEGVEKIQIKKSLLKFSFQNQPYNDSDCYEHCLNFSLNPIDDTVLINLEKFNIITSLKNEFTYSKKVYLKEKEYIFDETNTKLITIPEHSIEILFKGCDNYNIFKTKVLAKIYNDITYLIVDEIKKLTIPRLDITFKAESLDIENIIKDNFKIVTS